MLWSFRRGINSEQEPCEYQKGLQVFYLPAGLPGETGRARFPTYLVTQPVLSNGVTLAAGNSLKWAEHSFAWLGLWAVIWEQQQNMTLRRLYGLALCRLAARCEQVLCISMITDRLSLLRHRRKITSRRDLISIVEIRSPRLCFVRGVEANLTIGANSGAISSLAPIVRFKPEQEEVTAELYVLTAAMAVREVLPSCQEQFLKLGQAVNPEKDKIQHYQRFIRGIQTDLSSYFRNDRCVWRLFLADFSKRGQDLSRAGLALPTTELTLLCNQIVSHQKNAAALWAILHKREGSLCMRLLVGQKVSWSMLMAGLERGPGFVKSRVIGRLVDPGRRVSHCSCVFVGKKKKIKHGHRSERHQRLRRVRPPKLKASALIWVFTPSGHLRTSLLASVIGGEYNNRLFLALSFYCNG